MFKRGHAAIEAWQSALLLQYKMPHEEYSAVKRGAYCGSKIRDVTGGHLMQTLKHDVGHCRKLPPDFILYI
jgi:hypothetical protein